MTQVINEKNLNIDNLNNKINLQEENIKYSKFFSFDVKRYVLGKK